MMEDWTPVSTDFALLNAPIDRTVEAYTAWMKRLDKPCKLSEIADRLNEAFASLSPLSSHMTRKLFISAGPDWTGFFQNGLMGSDPTAGGHQLARELDVVGMRVCATPEDDLFPAVMWQVYAPQKLGGDEWGYRRSVAVCKDGSRWTFEQSGDPFPFEEMSAYRAMHKRDRFTKPMLRRYLTQCSVDPFTEGVLEVGKARPAIRLEIPAPDTPARELTYTAAALQRKK